MKESKLVTQKIWILCANRWNSAIAEYALNLARSLTKESLDACFICISDTPIYKRAVGYGIKTIGLRDFSIFGIVSLIGLFLSRRPNIIVSTDGKDAFAANILRLFSKSSLFIRFRGSPPRDARLFPKLSQNCFDGMILGSTMLAQSFEKVGITIEHSIIIPMGVDEEKYKYLERTYCNHPTLLIVGRLDPVKGYYEFLDFFSKILESWPSSHPQPRLKIIGQDANIKSSDLRLYVSRFPKLENCVTIVSERIFNIEFEMANSSVGIVSSIGSEYLCRVAEEFLMCGTPIMTTHYGSLMDVHFENSGIVFKFDDEDIHKYIEFIKISHDEPHQRRIDRALKAKKLYAFTSMSHLFEKFIFDLT